MKALRPAGFTLIEVVVAIVLSAIAMAAILPFLDRVFQLGFEPREQLREGLALQAAMEDLVAWQNTNALARVQERVGAENSQYLGQYRVLDNHFIAFADNSESAVVASNNLLKVTLQNSLGETATRLFAEPL